MLDCVALVVGLSRETQCDARCFGEATSAFPARVEEHDDSMPDDARHPDVDFYDAEGNHRWIDVSIVTPWLRSWPSEPQEAKAGALAAKMEGTKRRTK